MIEQENILRLAREAFEFDLIDNHCYVQSDFVQEDGCYIDDDVDFAWQATLAVVIAILPAIGEMVKAEAVAETCEACARVCDQAAVDSATTAKAMVSSGEIGPSLVAAGGEQQAKKLAEFFRSMAATPSRDDQS